MAKQHDKRPCRICGLAPRIRLSEHHGQVCLYYGVRLTPDEANDTENPLRRRCIRDGNMFTWPMTGLTFLQHLDWRKEHIDWSLKRRGLKAAFYFGMISIMLTLLGLMLRIYSLQVEEPPRVLECPKTPTKMEMTKTYRLNHAIAHF